MAPLLSRRGLVLGGLAAGLHAPAAARVSPAAMQPLIGLGYRPVDADEKGLWQMFDELERSVRQSGLVLPDPAFHDYTMAVVERLLGARARDVRAYLLHDPEFNASMAPNGMLVVNSGLLLRVRSEAQYAAVLGHEAGHYLRRHSVAGWRDRKRRTGMMAFVSAGSMAAAGVTARLGGDAGGWVRLANSINSSLALSILSYGREQEREADAFGIRLIAEAGYPPEAANAVWRQAEAEGRASANARHKHYRDQARSAYSTHPANEERMIDLGAAAAELVAEAGPGRQRDDGRAAWKAAIAPLRPLLFEELVKLNDTGSSLHLINAHAEDGWDGLLRFYQGEAYRLRGEEGDDARADRAYAAAVMLPDAPPEAWRGHGYALLKTGRAGEGKAALAHYLDLRPDAGDAAMVRFSIAG